MIFNGVIQQVLPKRSGTSARTGNKWETMGFIFEYKENATDRYPDRVLLETYSTSFIEIFEKWMEKDANGNPIVQNAVIRLTRPLYVQIGFSHKTRVYTTQQGEEKVINEIGIYDFKLLDQPSTPPTFNNAQQQPQDGGTGAAPQAAAPTTGDADDLPF